MAKFSVLPEFEKELKRLSKKYPSIESDILDIKAVLLEYPTGVGKNFAIIKVEAGITIVKAKIHCESLRSRAIRLIYTYHKDRIEFIYLEVYFKGDKENEDGERIREYLREIE